MNSDFKLKIVSLLLAIIVWFHAVTEKTYVAHVTLNIDYKLPRKTYIINSPPKTCDLTVRGKGKMLILFNMRKKKITCDLTKYKPGKHTVKVPVPRTREIEIINFSPQKVVVVLDREASKTVRVSPVITGTPSENFAIADITVSPDRVRIIGPSKLLSEIRTVFTQEVDIEGIMKSFARKVKVVVPYDSLNMIKAEPGEVSVMVTLEPMELDSIVLPLRIRSRKWRSFKFDPTQVTLFYRVPRSWKSRVARDNFSVWVEVDSSAKKGSYVTFPIKYKAPPVVKVIDIEPPDARVMVRR